MSISEVIKNRRDELGLKLKDVAAQVGVAESTYRDWENGRNIQGEPYIKIAKSLNISLGTLLGVEKREVMQSFLLDIALLEKHVKNIQQSATQII